MPGNAVIGALRVVLGADSAAFEKEMAGISAKLNAIGKNLAIAGAGLTAGVTLPILKLGQSALSAFEDSEKAVAAVEAAIKSTGGTAGYTSKQLQDMAAKLQSISTFDDDEILSKVTANMLTFGNVTGEAFDRAQLAVLNLSARLGQDLQSSAIQVGKALNDPVKGITALQRVGVAFTQTQKDMIKSMVEAGDIAGAQKIILDELFKEFGGQAEAAAKTTAGAWAQMLNSIGDAMEAIGKVIAPYVVMFANFVKSLAEAFSALPEPVQGFVVMMGAIAAAIGPVLIVLGMMLPALAALAPLFVAIASPVAIFVGALALVSFTLNEFGISFSQQWEVIKQAFGMIVTVFVDQIAVLKALFTGDFAGAWEALKKMISDTLSAVAGIVETLFPGITAAVQREVAALANAFVNMKNQAIQAVIDLYNGVTEWLSNKLTAAFDYVISKVGALSDAFWELYNNVVGHSYIPDMVTESTDWLKKMGVSMDKIGGDAVTGWNANMASMTSANATINSSEAASVRAANDNGGAFGAGRGRGDIYLGGITIQAQDAASFKQSKGQVQADLSDMVRAAFAGR